MRSPTPYLLLLSALLLACASDPPRSPKADERYAIIQTSASRKAQQIFPVLLTEIDGKKISITREDLRGADRGYLSGRSFYRIRPGTHEIRAMGIVDRSLVPGLSRSIGREPPLVLKQNFVSGKRYFIGLKADSPRSSEWALVVWKTEDTREGSLNLGEDD